MPTTYDEPDAVETRDVHEARTEGRVIIAELTGCAAYLVDYGTWDAYISSHSTQPTVLYDPRAPHTKNVPDVVLASMCRAFLDRIMRGHAVRGVEPATAR